MISAFRRTHTSFAILLVLTSPIAAQQAAPSFPLRGRILVKGEDIPVAMTLQIVGGQLVQVNLPPSAPVQIRDRETGSLVSEVGKWGAGEGDFVGPWSIDPVPNSSSAWIWDLTRHRLALLDVSHRRIQRWITVRADAALTSPVWSLDTLYSPGFFLFGRLARFNSAGAYIDFVGAAPKRADGKVESVLATQQAQYGILRANADRTAFALATRYGARLQILNRDGSQRVEAKIPERFEPRYYAVSRAGEVKVQFEPRSRFGYIDLCVTRERILALFSGKEEKDVGMYPDGQSIHVFDWSGAFLGSLALPAGVIALALDERDNQLLAMQTPPNTALVAFDLSRIPATLLRTTELSTSR